MGSTWVRLAAAWAGRRALARPGPVDWELAGCRMFPDTKGKHPAGICNHGASHPLPRPAPPRPAGVSDELQQQGSQLMERSQSLKATVAQATLRAKALLASARAKWVAATSACDARGVACLQPSGHELKSTVCQTCVPPAQGHMH